MIVEPFAHDDVAKNLNPIGRIMYSASATVCVPCSLSQEVASARARRRARKYRESGAQGRVYEFPQSNRDTLQHGV